jgi:hypothetical protein
VSQGVTRLLGMDWEARFMDRSSRQEGLLAKFQLGALGCTSDHWWRAKRTGRWIELSPRVIGPRGAPESEARRALAATLDSGPATMLHRRSALAWQGVRGYDLRSIEVARLRGMPTWESTLAQIHFLRNVRPHDLIVVGGVCTETALRAIWCEAAGYASPARFDMGMKKIGRLLDEANRLRLVTWAGLHEMVEDIHQRGRSGTVLMRALAEERQPGSSITESRNETQLEDLLAARGSPPLRRQIVVGGHEPVGRCDHRDDELPLVVETNSLEHHTSPSDRRADEARYEQLMDARFTVGVIWEDDLWKYPRGATDTVALARQYAAAGIPAVIHSPGCPWPPPHVGAPARRQLAA